jgi:hypothetical protein
VKGGSSSSSAKLKTALDRLRETHQRILPGLYETLRNSGSSLAKAEAEENLAHTGGQAADCADRRIEDSARREQTRAFSANGEGIDVRVRTGSDSFSAAERLIRVALVK